MQAKKQTNLSPGPELDAKVAETRGWEGSINRIRSETWKRPDGMHQFVPMFSTSISDSWELVEEIKGEIDGIYWNYNLKNNWSVELDPYITSHKAIDEFVFTTPTLPHAICLAYLEVRHDTPHMLGTASKGERNVHTQEPQA